jgi:hypothetical protein
MKKQFNIEYVNHKSHTINLTYKYTTYNLSSNYDILTNPIFFLMFCLLMYIADIQI